MFRPGTLQIPTTIIIGDNKAITKDVGIKEVTYITYPLGSDVVAKAGLEPLYAKISPGLQSIHVAVCLRLVDGTEKEYHMTDKGFKVFAQAGLYRNIKLGEYEIIKNPKGKSAKELDQLIRKTFESTKYKLGSNDCFKVVETTATFFDIDKKNLQGPVGDRKGIACGVRHVFS